VGRAPDALGELGDGEWTTAVNIFSIVVAKKISIVVVGIASAVLELLHAVRRVTTTPELLTDCVGGAAVSRGPHELLPRRSKLSRSN
jgi:hypothetical protein